MITIAKSSDTDREVLFGNDLIEKMGMKAEVESNDD